MRSYVEINKNQLITNYKAFKSLSPHKSLYAVLKGNAYGHGIKEVAGILEKEVTGFCVEDAQELEQLRRVTRAWCLVLGHVSIDEVLKEVMPRTVFSLFSWEQLPLFREMSQRFSIQIPVHVKIDALLGRQGFLADEVPTLLQVLQKSPFLEVQGLYAHLSSVKSGNTVHTRHQHSVFRNVVREFQTAFDQRLITHIDATGGLVFHPDTTYAAARLGAGLYGIWPSKEHLLHISQLSQVAPVMRWVSGVTQVKIVPANYPIGYDKTYVTTKETKIAVIPQGYADGFDRELSNRGYVLINGTRCAVLGRISMNVMVVDVSHLGSAKVGDEVVLLGAQGNEMITAQDFAQLAHTIPYESVTRVSPLLKRVIV